MQPRAPVSFLSFLGPKGRPQNGGFLHLIDKIADFLHNKLFFLIPRGICIIIGPVCSLAQTDCADKNTFLSLLECPAILREKTPFWGIPRGSKRCSYLRNLSAQGCALAQ